LAPAIANPMGTPCASVKTLRLTPRLDRSVGLGPLFFPTQGGLGHRAIQGLPAPAQFLAAIVFQQAPLPQLQKNTGLGPLLKPPVGGGTGTDAGGVQGIPLTAGSQHEKDAIHGLAGVHGGVMTTQRMRLAGRQQRLDLRPERIGNAPEIVVRNLAFLAYLMLPFGFFSHRLSPAAYVCLRDLYVNQAYWDRLLSL